MGVTTSIDAFGGVGVHGALAWTFVIFSTSASTIGSSPAHPTGGAFFGGMRFLAPVLRISTGAKKVKG